MRTVLRIVLIALIVLAPLIWLLLMHLLPGEFADMVFNMLGEIPLVGTFLSMLGNGALGIATSEDVVVTINNLNETIGKEIWKAAVMGLTILLLDEVAGTVSSLIDTALGKPKAILGRGESFAIKMAVTIVGCIAGAGIVHQCDPSDFAVAVTTVAVLALIDLIFITVRSHSLTGFKIAKLFRLGFQSFVGGVTPLIYAAFLVFAYGENHSFQAFFTFWLAPLGIWVAVLLIDYAVAKVTG